jgi:membrane protein DedA with SNARE-associated domain
MPVLNFTVAAFVGGAIRSSIFAYFGSALADASWTEVLLAAGLFVLATAVPLAFPTGRSWLREVFSPNQHEAD